MKSTPASRLSRSKVPTSRWLVKRTCLLGLGERVLRRVLLPPAGEATGEGETRPESLKLRLEAAPFGKGDGPAFGEGDRPLGDRADRSDVSAIGSGMSMRLTLPRRLRL